MHPGTGMVGLDSSFLGGSAGVGGRVGVPFRVDARELSLFTCVAGAQAITLDVGQLGRSSKQHSSMPGAAGAAAGRSGWWGMGRSGLLCIQVCVE